MPDYQNAADRAELIELTHRYFRGIDTGDRATVRAGLFAQHLVDTGDGAALMPGGGRYRFECVRHDARWIIAELENQVTWAHPGLSAVFRGDAS